jgi:hypothetical protein
MCSYSMITYVHIQAHKATVWCVRHLPQNRDLFMTGGGNGGFNLYKYHYPQNRYVCMYTNCNLHSILSPSFMFRTVTLGNLMWWSLYYVHPYTFIITIIIKSFHHHYHYHHTKGLKWLKITFLWEWLVL